MILMKSDTKTVIDEHVPDFERITAQEKEGSK